MKKKPRIPLFVWRVMNRLNRRVLSRYEANGKSTGRVLILTTIGRKSGQSRLTPLQYEEVEGFYYVASARGVQSDWYRNLMVNPKVEVQVGKMHFFTQARLMTDPEKIADFLEIRLKKHPHFMGMMLNLEGLPRNYTRTDLEKFAERLALVELQNENPGTVEL